MLSLGPCPTIPSHNSSDQYNGSNYNGTDVESLIQIKNDGLSLQMPCDQYG